MTAQTKPFTVTPPKDKRDSRVREEALASTAHIAPPSTDDDERVLSRKTVCEITDLSYPNIWEMIRNGAFPPARCISKNRVGWLKSEVIAWMRSRPVQVYKPPDTS